MSQSRLNLIRATSDSDIPKNFTGLVEWTYGAYSWFENGRLHKLDGPAFEYEQEFFVDYQYYLYGFCVTALFHTAFCVKLRKAEEIALRFVKVLREIPEVENLELLVSSDLNSFKFIIYSSILFSPADEYSGIPVELQVVS